MNNQSIIAKVASAFEQFEKELQTEHELKKRIFMRKYGVKEFRKSVPRTRLEYEANS